VDEFDVVVIGSGFGGAVTACRMAENGLSTCVLERGRAYPPNSFARSPFSFGRAFWDPGRKRTGLFNIWSFEHIDAVVSAGLGGGSLIYANVLIRKDEKWFAGDDVAGTPAWPVTREDLDPHYDVAEKMLNAQVFHMDKKGYSSVKKTVEFKRAAIEQGFQPTTFDKVDPSKRQWYLPLLAITFANEGQEPVPGEFIAEKVRNLHDRDRQTCRLTGECDLGCNYGAKNSLDYNYLTAAKIAGAEIRTLSNVLTIKPKDDGGFLVGYEAYEVDDLGEIQTSVNVELSARRLVVAAGTIGTNNLLLRNKSSFPAIGDALGRRFSGNGDLLTMALGAKAERGEDRLIDPSHGPVITSTLREPDEFDGERGVRGYYLQDAGYPGFVDWLVQVGQIPNDISSLGAFVLQRLQMHLLHRGSSDLDPALERLLNETTISAGSMPLLGMGRDVPGGEFSLGGDGGLRLDWNRDLSAEYFNRLTQTSKLISDSLGARFLANPITSLLGRLITVHSLGGCVMSKSEVGGVVNEWGEVHGYPGMYIADGSVMPGPVGANPSLTIAALAERFAAKIVSENVG
jgi:cholesterol oxidase